MRRIWRHGNGSVHLQFYMICSSLLSLDDGNINDLQSTRYGWEYLDDSMKYMKMLNLIPDAICVTSKCKILEVCRKSQTKFTNYCNCIDCKNISNNFTSINMYIDDKLIPTKWLVLIMVRQYLVIFFKKKMVAEMMTYKKI